MSSATFRCVYLTGRESLEMRRLPLLEPGREEVVVSILAATTCGTDVKVFRSGGHPRMLVPPCPFGHEMVGALSAVGREVREWRVGDHVVISNSACCGRCEPCRHGRENLCADLSYLNGAFAESLLVPPRFAHRSLYRLPATLSPTVAPLTEPLACVVHGLDRMRLRPASEVVVFGGGPIGLLFVWLLSRSGHRVTLADPHRRRLHAAIRFGAASTWQIRDRDHPLAAGEETGGGASSFDAAVDATGNPAVWRATLEVVKPGGTVNFFGGCPPGSEIALDTHRAHYHELTLLGSYHHRPATFSRALELLTDAADTLSDLLSGESPLDDLESALRAMIARKALKVVIRP